MCVKSHWKNWLLTLTSYYKKLENMTKDERLQYFRDNIAIENKLNFEKEINGTVYKVNTYFDENAEESILAKIFRLTKRS